jgi:hypothetical protein
MRFRMNPVHGRVTFRRQRMGVGLSAFTGYVGPENFARAVSRYGVPLREPRGGAPS